MAITDIQISEELETNAPSIKYRGDEGPKSPQEMEMMNKQIMEMMAGGENNRVRELLLKEETEGLNEYEKEELRELIKTISAQGPVLPSDEDPINPFGPKPEGPVLPDRMMAGTDTPEIEIEMLQELLEAFREKFNRDPVSIDELKKATEQMREKAAYGGIMGLDGRRQYGIGSSLKKLVRKVIPNEIAEVAVKAAPFVAPFNPLAAGLMSGIGGFDRTGRIGSSLKSGLMNYGLGQGARMLGGAGMQEGFNLKINPNATGLGQYFSSPMAAASSGINIDKGRGSALGNKYRSGVVEDPTGLFAEGLTGAGTSSTPITAGSSINVDKVSPLKKFTNKIMDYVPTSFGDVNPFGENFDIKKAAGAYGIYELSKKLLGTPKEVEETIISRGDGLDLDSIRLEVREAFKDPSGKKLAALRNKYPYLGTQASKDIANMAMGGRIGMAEGGIMDLGGMEKDYRNTGGFVDIGEYEKKDDVPARLSVNEFVMTADAVRGMGDGDIDLGAKRMENLMGAMENKKGAQQMFDVSERLSEVI